MSKESVHRARVTSDASSLDATQALVILRHLEAWLSVVPFRRVIIERDDRTGKWRATLETLRTPSETHGVSMTDALAQAATVAGVEVGS